MKSYMISLLVIGIALGGLGLGTFAYLSDQDITEGHSLSTGTVDLGVQVYGIDSTGNPVADGALVVEGLLPSEEYTPVGFVKIWNNGDDRIKWKGYVSPTGTDDAVNALFRANTNITLVKNPTFSWSLPDADSVALPWGGWNDGNDLVLPLSQLTNAWNTPIRGGDTIGGSGVEYMETYHWQVFRVEARINPTCADPLIQCQSYPFEFIFDSTQSENTVWPAPIVLT